MDQLLGLSLGPAVSLQLLVLFRQAAVFGQERVLGDLVKAALDFHGQAVDPPAFAADLLAQASQGRVDSRYLGADGDGFAVIGLAA